MEHIPSDNEKFECYYKGYNFRVLKAKNKMIQSVSVQKEIVEDIIDKTTIEEEEK